MPCPTMSSLAKCLVRINLLVHVNWLLQRMFCLFQVREGHSVLHPSRFRPGTALLTDPWLETWFEGCNLGTGRPCRAHAIHSAGGDQLLTGRTGSQR